MKFKSIVPLCALAALPVLATDVESSNTFGTMKVTCNAAKVMICTPWVECQTGSDVKLTNMVMTAGLDDEDKIIVYNKNDDKFYGWYLDGSEWKALTSVSVIGGTNVAGNAELAPIKRGEGFWFIKNGYTSGSYNLYLYGQDTTANATSTITAGAYNLLANPNASEFNIKNKITGAANGDSIQLVGGKLFRHNGKDWQTTISYTKKGRTVVSNGVPESITIPAATGFWYVSKGSSNGSIAWQ